MQDSETIYDSALDIPGSFVQIQSDPKGAWCHDEVFASDDVYGGIRYFVASATQDGEADDDAIEAISKASKIPEAIIRDNLATAQSLERIGAEFWNRCREELDMDPSLNFFNALYGYLLETQLRLPEDVQSTMAERWCVTEIVEDIHDAAARHGFAPRTPLQGRLFTAEERGIWMPEWSPVESVHAAQLYLHFQKLTGRLPVADRRAPAYID